MKTMSELNVGMCKVITAQLCCFATMIIAVIYAGEYLIHIAVVVSAITLLVGSRYWEKMFFERRKLEKLMYNCNRCFDGATSSPNMRLGDINSYLLNDSATISFAQGDDVIRVLDLDEVVLANCLKWHRKAMIHNPNQVKYVRGGDKGNWTFFIYEFKYYRVFFFLTTKH